MKRSYRPWFVSVVVLALPAGCTAQTLRVSGIASEGAGYAINHVRREQLRMTQAPRIANPEVTVSVAGGDPLMARGTRDGYFSLALPSRWLQDDSCTFEVSSADFGGMTLPCHLVLSDDLGWLDVRLPSLPRTVVLQDGDRTERRAGKGGADLAWGLPSDEFRLMLRDRLAALRTVDDRGKLWTSAELRGQWTLVQFWSPSCGPCVAERRRLSASLQSLSRNGVQILGVPSGLTAEVPTKGLETPWPQLAADGEMITREWRVERLPANVLINPAARVVAIDLHGPDMVESIVRIVRDGDADRR